MSPVFRSAAREDVTIVATANAITILLSSRMVESLLDHAFMFMDCDRTANPCVDASRLPTTAWYPADLYQAFAASVDSNLRITVCGPGGVPSMVCAATSNAMTSPPLAWMVGAAAAWYSR